MMIIYFFYGLSFWGLGLAASLQLRRGGDLPLRRQLPWLAAFGFAYGTTGWLDMFMASGMSQEVDEILKMLRMFLQPTSGLLLLIFGWGMLTKITPLPTWTHLLPGLLIAPMAFVITYATTTFITPSPLEIPIDIWSRYLLYLPGSIMAGIGFVRQWRGQKRDGLHDVASLMLAAGIAFLFEAFVVGLVVPAAPYGPASYYNYNRAVHDAFIGEQMDVAQPYGLTGWLDYDSVLEATGLPIQFWRMLSAFAVTLFVVRGLGVFEAVRQRQLEALQDERDRAQQAAFAAQIAARQEAENWTDALTSISRRIAELHDVDDILLYIVNNGRNLLHSDFVGLAILDGEFLDLELKCFANETEATVVNTAVKVTNKLILQSLRGNKPYCSDLNEPTGSFEGLSGNDKKGVSALAVVPLSLDEKPIGALWVARYTSAPYSDTDLVWLESLADQVVIAIQHGLMTSQLQSLSIVEERSRIAREMHDGLAQVLGYLNLQIQTLEALLKRDKRTAMEQELRSMRQAVQVAHADVRENILSLRTTLANEKGLVSAIHEYLNEFTIQTQIKTTFINHTEGALGLSSMAEVQLVCILQEALANVRKHAQAALVEVRIGQHVGQKSGSEQGEYILMEVADNGIGFSHNGTQRSFGLQTMHERALSVNGELDIRSTAGEGTSVICRLPCLQEENLHKQTHYGSS
jgi:nitrate/nitrite-specific signal transduction histidine kinase